MEKEKKITVTIRKNKSNDQMWITIPKNTGLKEGDVVELKKLGVMALVKDE